MNLGKLVGLITLLLFTEAATGIAQVQHSVLTKDEKEKGYKLLFNGHNLKGWHSYLKDNPSEAWKVKKAAIVLNGHKQGGDDLTSDGEYEDFDLKLEWKISPGGNSGIIFGVHESPKFKKPWLTGPEMQVLDNNKYPNHRPSKFAGSLYNLIGASPSAAKPAGQWNKVRIRKDGDHLTCLFNGNKVVDTYMWNDHWKKLINHSKFKNLNGFATYKKGHITLQNHGDVVWYRNIKIKKL